MSFPSPAASAANPSSWWSPSWLVTSVSRGGKIRIHAASWAQWNHVIFFLSVCSWRVLRHRVPPRRFCGVCAEQGERKHRRPGPQAARTQRWASFVLFIDTLLRSTSRGRCAPELSPSAAFPAVLLEVLESLACKSSLPVPRLTRATGNRVLDRHGITPVLLARWTDS